MIAAAADLGLPPEQEETLANRVDNAVCDFYAATLTGKVKPNVIELGLSLR